MSELGRGTIDYGDTPAYPGVYDASSAVVGAALEGVARVMEGDYYRTFQPIGGEKISFSVRGRAAEIAPDNSDEE